MGKNRCTCAGQKTCDWCKDMGGRHPNECEVCMSFADNFGCTGLEASLDCYLHSSFLCDQLKAKLSSYKGREISEELLGELTELAYDALGPSAIVTKDPRDPSRLQIALDPGFFPRSGK